MPLSNPASVNFSANTSSLASTTTVAATTTSILILSSSSARKGATIWNDSTNANLYLELGSAASFTSFTVKLSPGGYYELPFNYTGSIFGIWTSAVGSAVVKDFS